VSLQAEESHRIVWFKEAAGGSRGIGTIPPSYKIVVAILGGWSGGNGDENYVYTQVCVCVCVYV